jgi:hypothetical protein
VHATDVTNTLEATLDDVSTDTPAESVARRFADVMQLPGNVSWSLRNNAGDWLHDDRAIGSQVNADEALTVTPRAHLG